MYHLRLINAENLGVAPSFHFGNSDEVSVVPTGATILAATADSPAGMSRLPWIMVVAGIQFNFIRRLRMQFFSIGSIKKLLPIGQPISG